MALSLGVSSLISVASERLRVPALLPLLGAGLLLGKSGVNVIDADALGTLLSPLITIGIGLLIFEGALHLSWRELRTAPRALASLLTIGVVITWGLSALFANVMLGMGPAGALLFGAMLTVTGPTVVQPILRRVRVTRTLRTTLAGEAVLVDPIGVLLTIVTMATLAGAAVTPVRPTMLIDALRHLGFPITTGIAVGLVVGISGSLLGRALSVNGRIHPQVLNLLAVGVCMLAIGVGERITDEAGLVAVTVAAIVLANLRLIGVAELHVFKQQLATLTVGSLFVLLASRFEVVSLADTGASEALFVAVIIFAVRPLSAGAALLGSRLPWRERVFTALFAPRGIVALSVAVIAAERLAAFEAIQHDHPVPGAIVDLPHLVHDAGSFERVMFLVIVGTVVWASMAGPWLARWLRVGGSRPNGVLLIGGGVLSTQSAAVLQKLGVRVTLVDSRLDQVLRAQAAGVEAAVGDATDLRWLEEQVGTQDIGIVIAWTGNPDVDFAVARWGGERFGKDASALWAVGKVPRESNWVELGGGRLLDEVRDQVESGGWRIDSWSARDASRASTSIPFMTVVEGRPSLVDPGKPRNGDAPESMSIVGLVRRTAEEAEASHAEDAAAGDVERSES